MKPIKENTKNVLPILLIVSNHSKHAIEILDELIESDYGNFYLAYTTGYHESETKNILETKLSPLKNRKGVSTQTFVSNEDPKYADIAAIDWFFTHVGEGVILYDFNEPDIDFIAGCPSLLEKYREDEKIWQINSTPKNSSKNGDKISKTRALARNGWATWRDRWLKFEPNPFFLADAIDTAKWDIPFLVKKNLCWNLEKQKKGQGSWLDLWQISSIERGGRALCLSKSSSTEFNPSDRVESSASDEISSMDRLDPDDEAHLLKDYESEGLERLHFKQLGLLDISPLLRYAKNFLSMQLRIIINELLWSLVRKEREPEFVVLSHGRAGSTMLASAIYDALTLQKYSNHMLFRIFGQRLMGWRFMPRIPKSGVSSNPVVKSHDIFNISKQASKNTKYIYIHSDPLDSVDSAFLVSRKEGSAWLERHIYNLRGKGRVYTLKSEDVLNYVEQTRAWRECEEVFSIELDNLWNMQSELNAFVGIDVSLPEFRSREAGYSDLDITSDLKSRLTQEARGSIV